MSLYFECAGISYKINGMVPTYITQDIAPYLTEERGSDLYEINCYLKYVSELEPVAGKPVFQNPHRLILDNNGKECRVHFQNGFPVSYYNELSDSEMEIQFLNQLESVMDMHFLEHFALEKYLLRLNGFILHACVIKYNSEAIVFSAPSGTGKSTQGNLWAKYKNAEIINGDKCIIQKRDNYFWACGLPFCGSSTVNKNEIIPLKAIVVLSQAVSDSIEVINTSTAVKKLMSETSINYWNSEFVNRMISLITETTFSVPVLHLACTPTVDAIDILYKFLYQ